MKRKKQTKKSSASESPIKTFSNLPKDKKRRVLLQGIVGIGALGGGAVAISAYDNNKRTMHDLSTIGAGNAVVVQIHDTGCSICRALKTTTTSALESHDAVDFRIADIASSKGRAFADKYRVQKTTLLFFNDKGDHVHTARGAQTREAIDAMVAAHL